MDLGCGRAVGQARAPVAEAGHAGGDLADQGAEVAGAEERRERRHRVLAHRSGEATGVVAQQPVRHVAAVREPEQPDAPGIGEALRDRPVDGSHQVGVVVRAPVVLDRAREVLAVAGRPARIRV